MHEAEALYRAMDVRIPRAVVAACNGVGGELHHAEWNGRARERLAEAVDGLVAAKTRLGIGHRACERIDEIDQINASVRNAWR